MIDTGDDNDNGAYGWEDEEVVTEGVRNGQAYDDSNADKKEHVTITEAINPNLKGVQADKAFAQYQANVIGNLGPMASKSSQAGKKPPSAVFEIIEVNYICPERNGNIKCAVREEAEKEMEVVLKD